MKLKSLSVDLNDLIELEPLLFKYGFLIYRNHPAYFVPSSWIRHEMFGAHLAIHPDSIITSCGQILILGEIFHTENHMADNFLVAEMLDSALTKSKNEMYHLLEYCNGNYVIAFYDRSSDEVVLVNDATGLSPIFYDRELNFVGSHALLVALNATRTHTVQMLSIKQKFGFPGMRTPYINVFQLNPNLSLHFSSSHLQRYNLIEALPTYSINELISEFSQLLNSSVQAFARRRDLVMSLTAGLDSRTTLSSCKNTRNVEYFTYYRFDERDTDAADKYISRRISKENNLSHKLILPRDNPAPGNYLKLCAYNSYYRHLPDTSYNYYKIYSERDVFHLRSNLSEIGRAFYAHALKEKPTYCSVDSMLACYISGSLKRRLSRTRDSTTEEFYRLAFEEYGRRSFACTIDSTFDCRDVFYWEHRMGTWHSQVVSESSPAFFTVSAYNCDRILKLMLSVPFEDRKAKKLFLAKISRDWPELLNYPINPKMADLPGQPSH